VRPFFGDQYFFGMRVEDLGVGICLKKWGAHSFARALWEATHSERMITKARVLGEQIRKVCLHLFFYPTSLCHVFRFFCTSSPAIVYLPTTLGKRRRHSHPVYLPRYGVCEIPDEVQGGQKRISSR
jgi:hypothetical protein